MKLTLLTVVALCVYAQAAVYQIENVAAQEIHFGQQEFSLKTPAVDSDITEDDQLLISELTQLENIQGHNFIVNTIQDLFENLRPIVINGDEANGIPRLDPFNVPHIGPFEYTTLGTRLNVNLHNFNVQGLGWYVLDHVSFNTLRLALAVQVTVPWLEFSGTYDANGILALIRHDAGGNYRVFVNRLEVGVDLRLGTNILGGGHLTLRELDINIVIHDISVRIDGLTGSSLLNSLINLAIQNAAQNLLKDGLADLSNLISRELFDTINEILRNFTLDDLLG